MQLENAAAQWERGYRAGAPTGGAHQNHPGSIFQEFKPYTQSARVCPRGGTWVYAFSESSMGDFPHGPEIKTSPSSTGDMGLIPGRGAKILHASGPKNQNINHKKHCNKFNKDFKNGLYLQDREHMYTHG